ncbi:vitamin D 25-hydroxylase-like [Clavelina lepadiformis]|uniref:Cytochrome P450 n=1 Tax=Clavelina lepadiformis TaxID=159417 RepID=A0ABP0GLS0_CLALP
MYNPLVWLLGENLNAPNTLCVFGAIFVASLYYWYKRPNNFPPGPRGIPLLGYMPFMGKYPEAKLLKLSKTYGPVMSIRLATAEVVAFNEFNSLHEALIKHPNKFSGRIDFEWMKDISKNLGLVTVDYGPFFRSQRKFGFHTLRGFGMGKKSMESRVIEEAAFLNENFRSHEGKPFEVKSILRAAVANNASSVIFGKRYSYDDKEFAKIIEIMLEEFEDQAFAAVNLILFFAPKLVNIPPFTKFHRQYARSTRIFIDMIRKSVIEHEETYDEENPRDFIDAFLKEIKAGSDFFSNEQLFFYVRDLMIAGTETTSTYLTWTCVILLHYPQMQKKLRQEINEIIGPSGTVQMSHKPKMHYTSAFIQELLRFRTALPMTYHKMNEDAEFNGYSIPKDTMILVNMWAVHNDPNVWVEPLQFNPQRFLDADGKFIVSNQVIPFSLGARRCVGEQLARMEIFLLLVSIIQKFEILPDPDAEKIPALDDAVNGLIYSPFPLRIVAKQI